MSHIISLPERITVTDVDGFTQEIVVEPAYPGYGLTLGNAMRRVLLSSLPGAAITGFKIKGVQHEFSTLPHVKEDVVQIILNLKRVELKLHDTEEATLTLSLSGAKTVTAGDFSKNAQVEILNPDHVLLTTTDAAANIEMEVTVASGLGYETVESREKEKTELGVIAIDALYGPVKDVSFKTENVRVGQMTNYDKIIFRITTNGSISGKDAFKQAAHILVEQFGYLERLEESGKE